jgi:3-deoxy-7-phosphoheptulonate synthase
MTATAEPMAEPGSWRGLPAAQQPDWPDPGRLQAVTDELAGLPPLVFAGECDMLRERLAAVARGEAFVLQGGDCAETFAGATADAVRAKLQTLLQMAVVLTYGASVPIIKIGRMAGQFHARVPPRYATASSCPPTAVTRSTGSSSPRRPARRTLPGYCAPITARP